MNVDTLWQDFRHGLRLLRLNAGFTCVALLSLALGIGANTAIFQLLDAVRLRMLPVNNPQELVELRIDSKTGRSGSFINGYSQFTYAQWEALRSRQQAISTASSGSGRKPICSSAPRPPGTRSPIRCRSLPRGLRRAEAQRERNR